MASFAGLALDEINESDKTDQRIADWLEQLKPDFPPVGSLGEREQERKRAREKRNSSVG